MARDAPRMNQGRREERCFGGKFVCLFVCVVLLSPAPLRPLLSSLSLTLLPPSSAWSRQEIQRREDELVLQLDMARNNLWKVTPAPCPRPVTSGRRAPIRVSKLAARWPGTTGGRCWVRLGLRRNSRFPPAVRPHSDDTLWPDTCRQRGWREGTSAPLAPVD